MNRRHHRITRATIPSQPWWWWLAHAVAAASAVYALAVVYVNVTSLP